MDEEKLPELGTKAAAVAGIESLIFTAIRVPGALEPERLRYWLDAYYQVRKAAEDELAELQAEKEREEILAALTTPHVEKKEDPGADVSAPPEQAAEGGGQTKERIAAAPAEPRNDSDGKKRQRPVGWTDGFEPYEPKKASPASEAAAYKREQHERLQKNLREGVTMQRIVKAAEGNITEDQILGIRECRRVPVAVYRVLEAALDRIEAA